MNGRQVIIPGELLPLAALAHGPAFCEQTGTTAERSRAADRLCKNLDIPVEACGARMPEVSSSAMTEYAFACTMISLREGARA